MVEFSGFTSRSQNGTMVTHHLEVRRTEGGYSTLDGCRKISYDFILVNIESGSEVNISLEVSASNIMDFQRVTGKEFPSGIFSDDWKIS
jgi:hypothetical protein